MLILIRKGSSDVYLKVLLKSFSHWLVLTHLHLLWNLTGTLIHLTLELHHYTAGLCIIFFLVGHLLSFNSFPLVFSFLWEVSDICPTYFSMNTKAHLLSFYF